MCETAIINSSTYMVAVCPTLKLPYVIKLRKFNLKQKGQQKVLNT
jgi:hypothetical protein